MGFCHLAMPTACHSLVYFFAAMPCDLLLCLAICCIAHRQVSHSQWLDLFVKTPPAHQGMTAWAAARWGNLQWKYSYAEMVPRGRQSWETNMALVTQCHWWVRGSVVFMETQLLQMVTLACSAIVTIFWVWDHWTLILYRIFFFFFGPYYSLLLNPGLWSEPQLYISKERLPILPTSMY